jgi:hypothetical protein
MVCDLMMIAPYVRIGDGKATRTGKGRCCFGSSRTHDARRRQECEIGGCAGCAGRAQKLSGLLLGRRPGEGR